MAGTTAVDVEPLHPMDEAMVVEQVTAAGFEKSRRAEFLRDRSDDHTVASFRVGVKTDRFVQEFIKPG